MVQKLRSFAVLTEIKLVEKLFGMEESTRGTVRKLTIREVTGRVDSRMYLHVWYLVSLIVHGNPSGLN